MEVLTVSFSIGPYYILSPSANTYAPQQDLLWLGQ